MGRIFSWVWCLTILFPVLGQAQGIYESGRPWYQLLGPQGQEMMYVQGDSLSISADSSLGIWRDGSLRWYSWESRGQVEKAAPPTDNPPSWDTERDPDDTASWEDPDTLLIRHQRISAQVYGYQEGRQSRITDAAGNLYLPPWKGGWGLYGGFLILWSFEDGLVRLYDSLMCPIWTEPALEGLRRYGDTALLAKAGPLWTLVSRSGDTIMPARTRFSDLEYFGQGLIKAYNGRLWGLSSPEGYVRVAHRYENLIWLEKDRFAARLPQGWGVIDPLERLVVQPRYASIAYGCEGRPQVERQGRIYWLDEKGQEWPTEGMLSAQEFAEGWLAQNERGNFWLQPKQAKMLGPARHIQYLGQGEVLLYESGVLSLYDGKSQKTYNRPTERVKWYPEAGIISILVK